MNWFAAFRYAMLVIFVCGVGGCSQKEPTASERTTESAHPAESGVDDLATPGKLRNAIASVNDISPDAERPLTSESPSNSEFTGSQDEVPDPSGSNDSVVQASAVQPDPDPVVYQPPAAPPAPIDVPAILPDANSQTDSPEASVAREPLFVNWPAPTVALLLTGRQHGYMEPCGCSGLENQNGGLVRRSTLIKQLMAKGWPVIPIDAGNQVRRFGRQAEIKFQITAEGLGMMGYQAVGFGPDDLRLPTPELVGIIANIDGDDKIFVSANVELFGEATLFTSPFRVIEKGGKKIGITAVIGGRNQKMVKNNSDVTIRPAEEGIKRVWPQLQQAKCDLYVLISHATMEESMSFGKMFPQFKVVVTTGGAGEPSREPENIEGTNTQLIQVGTKGMFAGVVALFDDPATPIRYQRIPLDARFPDSPELLQLLADYQDRLKVAGFEGLGIRPQPLASGLEFVGSAVCDDCHDEEFKIWKQGAGGRSDKHAHAYATLQHPPNERGGIPRNFDPECLSCHVVGWNPQKYFPYKSGFLNLEETPQLIDVGCENCHGPGSRHVDSENGDLDVDDDEIDAIRESMWLALEDAEQTCLECHDLDNSPAFQEEGAFERYWQKIEH